MYKRQDLVVSEQRAVSLSEIVVEQAAQIEALQEAVWRGEAIIETLQVERARLLAGWQEENRLRLEAENRPALGSWAAWAIAAAEAVGLAILAGVIAAG